MRGLRDGLGREMRSIARALSPSRQPVVKEVRGEPSCVLPANDAAPPPRELSRDEARRDEPRRHEARRAFREGEILRELEPRARDQRQPRDTLRTDSVMSV